MSDQPLQPEGVYLLYLLQASEDGAMPAWRTELLGDVTWLERQERAALFALGRIRESLCHRIKRLGPGEEERDYLTALLVQCQGDGLGGGVVAPRWPAQALGSVVGMIRTRLTTRRIAA